MLSDKTVDEIKNIVDDLDIVDDEEIEEIGKARIKVSVDHVGCARLFIRCYDHLCSAVKKFRSDKYNCDEEMFEYLDSFDVDKLRGLLSDFGDGERIGDHYTCVRINMIVERERKGFVELINIFYKIFIEESE